MSNYDVIIVGSGIVGAATALMLAQQTALKIAVLEAKSESSHERMSAISLASKRIFERLGVWEAIKTSGVSRFAKIHVWDEAGNGQIDFDCADVNEFALGYIIQDSAIRSNLIAQFSACQNIDYICPIKLIALQRKPEWVELLADGSQILTTKLLIAADGAQSWVRAQTNIELKTHDYEQTAIVATVKTTLPHQLVATQRFLSTGPLAFLPLSDEQLSSIVWSAEHEYASELLALNDEDFSKRLAEAFAHKLGQVEQVTKRQHFPLQMRHAKKYVQERIALIGDAAHTIHPLAGQGVNLGLLDAACLSKVIIQAVNKDRDFSKLSTLRKYERQRKSDNTVMLVAVDALKSLFANQGKTLQGLRNLGLNLTNRAAVIKKIIMHYALGSR